MDRFDYFIIGNSAAAVAAIEGIRKHDRRGTIGLCSAERCRAYSRPLISYLLEGKVTPEKMYLRPPEFCRRHGVRTLLGYSAVALDADRREVRLKSGDVVSYGKLLVATGGAPFVPPVPGLPRKVQGFTCWADAARLARVAQAGKRALVLGGGLIGVKAAEALRARGLDVTVVELAGGILTLSLDERAGDMAAECLRATGVKLFCGTTVERLEVRRGKRAAVLRDGAEVPYDIFVCAVGVRPNVEVARTAGLKIRRGVAVNERLETSAPGVYAAGDVAEGRDILAGVSRPLPIWPSASRQGRIAGYNMAGAQARHEGGFGMNSVQIHDVPFISAGLVDVSDARVESLERYDARGSTYRRVLVLDDRIVGFVVVGNVDRAGIYTGLMRDGVSVRHFRDELLDDTFGYISLPREMRKERLSRVSTI